MTTRIINSVAINYNSLGGLNTKTDHWKMSDELKNKIEDLAHNDARAGVYGSQEYLDLKMNELEKVAPDRAALKSRAMMLQRQNHTTANDTIGKKKGTVQEWIARMTGEGSNGETIKSDGPNMHVYDKDGTEILTYDSWNGWVEKPSKAESFVGKTIRMTYYAAYSEAEKNIKKDSGFNTYIDLTV